MTEEPALSCQNVSKSFTGTLALSSVDLSVERGSIRALLGENGSGKSTLVKILSGYHQPDPGSEVRIGGTELPFGSPEAAHRLGARFVHQDLGLVDSASVTDNLSFNSGYPTRFGTISRKKARSRAATALESVGLSIDPDRLVESLLPAEKTGVAISRALREDDLANVHLLVLDEPTATLPEHEVTRLLDIIRSLAKRSIGVLYISHHLDEVFAVADDVTVFRDGHEVISRAVTGMSREQLINYLVGDEFVEARREANEASVTPAQREVVVQTRNLKAERLDDVSLQVSAGEVVGVAGVTGSGRESLCGAIFGALPRRAGNVLVKGKVLRNSRPDLAMSLGVAYLPADRKRSGGFMAMTCRENLSISDLRPFWGRIGLNKKREHDEAKRLFEEFDVRPAWAFDEPLGSLSGGNQQKVLFAKWLRRSPQLLLLDEPTQGVDVKAKASLHHQIQRAAQSGAAILISSSDEEELAAICHRVLIFRSGKNVAELLGSEVSPKNISRKALEA